MRRYFLRLANAAKKPLVSLPRSVTMPVHRPGGEIGRHKRLKISRQQWRTGSIPVSGTMTFTRRSLFHPASFPAFRRHVHFPHSTGCRIFNGKISRSIATSSSVFFLSSKTALGYCYMAITVFTSYIIESIFHLSGNSLVHVTNVTYFSSRFIRNLGNRSRLPAIGG